MKLKHGEKVSATANKHGKFTLKVKNNNLTKLKFKLKATKTGLKARTYTHKVKKAVQSIDDGATTETQTAPVSVKPDSASAEKKPEKGKDKEKQHNVFIHDYKTVESQIADAATELKQATENLKTVSGLEVTTFPFLSQIVNARHDESLHKSSRVSTPEPAEPKKPFDKLKDDEKYKSNAKLKSLIENEQKTNKLYQAVNRFDKATAKWTSINNALTSAHIPAPASSPMS